MELQAPYKNNYLWRAHPFTQAQYLPNDLDAKLGTCITNINTKSKTIKIARCKVQLRKKYKVTMRFSSGFSFH